MERHLSLTPERHILGQKDVTRSIDRQKTGPAVRPVRVSNVVATAPTAYINYRFPSSVFFLIYVSRIWPVWFIYFLQWSGQFGFYAWQARCRCDHVCLIWQMPGFLECRPVRVSQFCFSRPLRLWSLFPRLTAHPPVCITRLRDAELPPILIIPVTVFLMAINIWSFHNSPAVFFINCCMIYRPLFAYVKPVLSV